MMLRLENRAPQSPIHVIWGAFAIIVIAAAGFIKPYMGLLPGCMFHRLFGIPCPTCGGTRSLAALSGFNIESSFYYNPLVMLGIMTLILFSLAVLMGIILKRRVRLSFSDIEKKLIRYSILFAIIANWAFLIFYRKL